MRRIDPLSRLGVVLATFFLLLITVQTASGASQMPSFVLTDAVSGDDVNSKQFEGKILLITFFATWCPPCMQEIPDLIDLHDKYASKGFSVLGLSMDQGGRGIVKKLVEKRSINYPILMADEATANDFGGVVGIPTSFLVNKKGRLVKKYPGYVPHAILERDIQSVMN